MNKSATTNALDAANPAKHSPAHSRSRFRTEPYARSRRTAHRPATRVPSMLMASCITSSVLLQVERAREFLYRRRRFCVNELGDTRQVLLIAPGKVGNHRANFVRRGSVSKAWRRLGGGNQASALERIQCVRCSLLGVIVA